MNYKKFYFNKNSLSSDLCVKEVEENIFKQTHLETKI